MGILPASLLKGNRSAMVTTEEMRLFALECLRWSEETDNASHRDLMVRIAKTWMETPSTITWRTAIAFRPRTCGLNWTRPHPRRYPASAKTQTIRGAGSAMRDEFF